VGGAGETVLLAQPAAPADPGDDLGAGSAVWVFNGFDREIRTIFLADEAVFVLAPGDAASPVNPGGTHFKIPLFPEGEITNRLGRASLSAFVAEFVAFPDLGDETGSENPLPAAFQQGGLKASGETDPDAAPAAEAAVGKVVFGKSSRGPDEAGMNPGISQVKPPPKKSRQKAAPQKKEGFSPPRIDRRRFSFRYGFKPGHPIKESAERADFKTPQAPPPEARQEYDQCRREEDQGDKKPG